MAATSINTELNRYISLLTPSQKKSVLSLIKSFVSADIAPTRISIEQYNEEIDTALAEAASGNYITQEELEKEAAKW
jgi:hypothetical protein